MKLKELLESSSDTFQMYHGGKEWIRKPSDIKPSKSGRYEMGVGLYFTNSKLTARGYAKGSRSLHLVDIKSDIKDVDDVYIDVEIMVDFVRNCPRLRKKEILIADIHRNQQRTGKKEVSLGLLNNLIINYEVGAGSVGLEITKFFVEHGGQCNWDGRSGKEWWLVIFDPTVIVGYKKLTPTDQDNYPWMLEIPPSVLPKYARANTKNY